MESLICRAINEHRLLEIRYRASDRMIEPYLLYRTKAGKELVHGYVVDGLFDQDRDTHWCNLRVELIESAELSELRYEQPRPGFNPQSARFHEIVCSI
jgi:WYL domain